MTDDVLFPGYEPAEPPEALSADRRRTLRQRQDVANGVHPLMRTPTDPEHTCGTCVHRIARGFPKCAIGPQSHSASTDVRAWWPACQEWEPADDR